MSNNLSDIVNIQIQIAAPATSLSLSLIHISEPTRRS